VAQKYNVGTHSCRGLQPRVNFYAPLQKGA
jgi:hypothetical protein